jgi:hypothetical protein
MPSSSNTLYVILAAVQAVAGQQVTAAPVLRARQASDYDSLCPQADQTKLLSFDNCLAYVGATDVCVTHTPEDTAGPYATCMCNWVAHEKMYAPSCLKADSIHHEEASANMDCV